MTLEQFGELRARVVGEGDALTVVLLHGFGAPGDDLVPLAHVLGAPAGTRFIFPEAPITFDVGIGESRAWWMIDVERIQRRLLLGEIEELKREVPSGMREANQKVERLLDEVQQRYQIAGTRLVLGGFSQGAMLSLDVALMSDRTLAGLVLLSGTLLAADDWRPRMAARAGLPVFQSHGQLDPILPFMFAEALRDELVSAGLDHTWVPFMGGHEIPPKVLEKLSGALGRMG